MWSLTPLTSSTWRVCQFERHWLQAHVELIYLDALRNLGNGTESVECRKGERSELERDHGCLSVWFLGGVVRCKRWDRQKAMLSVVMLPNATAGPRTDWPEFQRPRPAGSSLRHSLPAIRCIEYTHQ